jgi:hypothetical protein
VLNISLELEIEPEEPYKNRALRILLWALIHLDQLYLRRFPATPRLYDAGVRYMREPWRYEQWITVPRVLAQGGADCEDLAAWRIAELRNQGFNARPSWRPRQLVGPDGEPFTLYHIRVFIPGWGFEDPSKRLGMRRAGVPVIPYPAHWAQSPAGPA